MLLWIKASSLSSRDSRRAQDLHPHRRRFTGMVRKKRYLVLLSTNLLFHKLYSIPILWYALEMRFFTSASSVRLYEMTNPR
jgi:hypothetical protein